MGTKSKGGQVQGKLEGKERQKWATSDDFFISGSRKGQPATNQILKLKVKFPTLLNSIQ